MKSLNYILFHSLPKNLDDCLHYASSSRSPKGSATVTLDIHVASEVQEGYILSRVTGRYTWVFPDGVRVEFARFFGGYLVNDGEQTRLRSRSAADARIRSDIGRISRLGLPLEVRRYSPQHVPPNVKMNRV